MTPGIDIRVLVAGAYGAGALAVLRVFGNGATVLQQVRDAIASILDDNDTVSGSWVLARIDYELAALTLAK